jgi:signal transduction histidine kinase
MSRSLKILSRSQHPQPTGSEGSVCDGIPKKASLPDPDTRRVRQAHANLSPPFGLSSTPGVFPSTFHLWREAKGRPGENSGQKSARREQTPKEEKKARSLCLEKRIALETINKLMVTISHYLSNPLTILLGKVELLSEATENGGMLKEDIKKFTDSCKLEIYKIDSIVKVFQNLCEVRYKTYPPGIKMFDVEMEIKDRLKEVEVFDIIGNKKG